MRSFFSALSFLPIRGKLHHIWLLAHLLPPVLCLLLAMDGKGQLCNQGDHILDFCARQHISLSFNPSSQIPDSGEMKVAFPFHMISPGFQSVSFITCFKTQMVYFQTLSTQIVDFTFIHKHTHTQINSSFKLITWLKSFTYINHSHQSQTMH